MKLRWKILIAMGLFLVLVSASMVVTLHVQPEKEVEAYKKSLLAKGEKLEISEVLPARIPDGNNALALVQMAFGMLVPNDDDFTNSPPAMHMVAPGRAMVGVTRTNLMDPGKYGFTNSWENALAAVEANGPALDVLRQGAGFPAVDFQVQYHDGFRMLLPHLAPLKRCARILTAAAMCDLHKGNSASAATNICASLALIQQVHDERTIISQLVRFLMFSVVTSATWEFLQSTNLTDEELAQLQQGWERVQFIEPVENSLLMERASTGASIEKTRTSAKDLDDLLDLFSASGSSGGSGDWLDDLKESWNKAKMSGAKFMWRASWSYSDELEALRGQQVMLEAMRTIRTNQFFNPAYSNMVSQLDAMGVTNSPEEWFEFLAMPDVRRIFSDSGRAFNSTVLKTMRAEACKHLVIAAIALKRFEMKHGAFPERLSELTPEYLPAVPTDPVDGKPLRYRNNPDSSYLLYSIGNDARDDGGDPTVTTPTSSSSLYWQNPYVRDWVWPQPASPAEIQYYFEHPPK